MYMKKAAPAKGGEGSNVFLTQEMVEILAEIERTRHHQKTLDAEVETACKRMIDKKFDNKLLDELESLEKQEVDLENKHMRLCKDYLTIKQKVRREVLKKEKEKLAVPAIKVDEILDSASLSVIETRVFGKSTKSYLTKGEELTHDLSTWELDPSEIKVFEKQKLGKGTFGSVVKGQLRGKTVAVKTIDANWKSDGEVHTKILDDFRNECAVMTKLLHPNVLLLMGVCLEPEQGKLIMVTELMPRGSVFDLLHNSDDEISFKQRMRFARDTALGVNWLHLSNPPILHLDLKTQNILVDENWVAKVADFGLSRIKKTEQKGAVGSPLYMAPEVLAEQPYSEKADVYSFGIIVWELLTQMIPYEDKDFETVADVFRYVVKQQKRPTMPDNCPPRLAKLIGACLEHDPRKRPSFKTILEGQVLDEIMLDAVISDANALAREFWLRSFKTKEGTIRDSVPWKEFVKTLIKYCSIQLPKKTTWKDALVIKALHLVLVPNAADSTGGQVSIEDFGNVLEWFGPFTSDETFVKRVQDVIKMNGFYGDCTSENAERQMAGKKVGTYIIRFSSKPGYYTITAVESEDQLKHYRIKHRAGSGFMLGTQEYPTLKELLKARKKDLGLKRALMGSKYAQLFVAHDTHMGADYARLAD
jgi:serine/threonine protein kinase/peroxiredoxin family protein